MSETPTVDEYRLAARLGAEMAAHAETRRLLAVLADRLEYVLQIAVPEQNWPMVGVRTLELISEARKQAL